MAVQRLVLDDFEEDYALIGIHCSLESYRVAFMLNKYLNLRLSRKKDDVVCTFDDMTVSFPFFQYQDSFKYVTYNLLGNTYFSKVAKEIDRSQDLFSSIQNEYHTYHLMPELKKVDYFLKIDMETLGFSNNTILKDIQKIPQIISAYMIDYNKLKSRNNLIFE